MGEPLKRFALLSLLLTVSAFAAEGNFEEARAHFKRGGELYDENNFRGALVEFERAYQLVANFKLLYNIGQVHLQLQDYAQAVKALQRYLNEGGAEVNPQRREEISREIERLKFRIGQLTLDTAKGAEVL